MLFVVLTGGGSSIAELTFAPTWQETFSIIFLLIFVLLMYHSLKAATRQVEEKISAEEKTHNLERQLDNLAEQNILIQKSQLEILNLQKNLSQFYNELDELIAREKISDAKEFIRRQSQFLDSTTIKIFCKSPLVNAALSIYFRRAKNFGIKTSFKVDLPEKIPTDENDLAILISNLLENAIKASKNNPRKEINLILRYSGNQNILEITNFYNFPIKTAENGLPYTTQIGHGLGMNSLEIFAKKYNAFVDFSHENNIVQFSVYWNDLTTCEQSTA